jgi:hypothetical protein
MNIEQCIQQADEKKIRNTLVTVLSSALDPAFCAVPKRELELSLLDALIDVSYLSDDPSVYDLVQGLRVTRAKARSLLYDRELRRQSPASLDNMAKQALSSPLLQNQEYAVGLDIENPYLADHIRASLRHLGHTSDGSFSPNLIRLSPAAAAALIERSPTR